MRLRLIAFIFSLGLLYPLSYASAGTILSSYKYAWSNNVGYINFENVVVEDTVLSGYAWSANAGWIKFSTTEGRVSNDGSGNLSGSAWGEQLGWIDFDNVTINPTNGTFSGTATGTLIGTLTFDCHFCDVRTDWRKSTSAPTPPSGGVGGGSGYIINPNPTLIPTPTLTPIPVPTPTSVPIIPQQITTRNKPLIVPPGDYGTVTKDTSAGPVVVRTPVNTSASKITFSITTQALATANRYLVASNRILVNNVFYEINARDQNGNLVRSFSSPLNITLPVPVSLTGAKNLAVYWYNVANKQWVLFPEAVFGKNKVTFQLDYLAKLAIFTTKSASVVPPSPSIPVTVQPVPPTPSKPPTPPVTVVPVQPSFLEQLGSFLLTVFNKFMSFFK